MKIFHFFILVLMVLLFGTPSYAGQLEPLNDQELQSVSGGEALQFDLRLRNNVNENNDPIGCSGNLNPCRLGLEFTDRDGRWLMLKEFYGTLDIQDVRLQSASLNESDSPYRDATRFEGSDGHCLLTNCDPNGLSAIGINYPFNKEAGHYQDLKTFLNIGRVGIEFDHASNGGVTPGYLRDQNDASMISYRISDSSAANAPMQMRFDGSALIYGF